MRAIVPADVERDSRDEDEFLLLINLALLAALAIPCFIAEYLYFDLWSLAGLLALAGVVMVASPLLSRSTGRIAVGRETFLFSLYGFKVWEVAYFGSIVSPGAPWIAVLPAIGILVGSRGSGLTWLVISALTIAGFCVVYGDGDLAAAAVHPRSHVIYAASLISVLVTLTVFGLVVDQDRTRAFRRLEEANAAIHELATRDPLTGAYNRRYITARLARDAGEARSGGTGFSVFLIDIDRFKVINDTHGHQAGDVVIQSVSAAVTPLLAAGDCFGRYGGEEFICIVSGEDPDWADRLAERIRRAVAALRLEPEQGLVPVQVTVSIGVAAFNPEEGFEATLRRADAALYAAKEAGRNRVCRAQRDMPILAA